MVSESSRFSSYFLAIVFCISAGLAFPLSERAAWPARRRSGWPCFASVCRPRSGSPVAYAPARKIEDPLSARGITPLLGAGRPDRPLRGRLDRDQDGGHDAWREELARAAETSPDRVAVHTVHQHDGPPSLRRQEQLLTALRMGSQRFDTRLHAGRSSKRRRQSATRCRQPARYRTWGSARPRSKKWPRTAASSAPTARENRYMSSTRSRRRLPRRRASSTRCCECSAYGTERSRCLPELLRHASAKPLWQGQRDARFSRPGPQSVRARLSGRDAGLLHRRGRQRGGRKIQRRLARDAHGADGRIVEAMPRAWESTRKRPLRSAVDWRVERVRLPLSPRDAAALESACRRDCQQSARLSAASKLAYLRRVREGPPARALMPAAGRCARAAHAGRAVHWCQLAAQQLCPANPVCMAAYGDCKAGYIGTKIAYGQGGYETGPQTPSTSHPLGGDRPDGRDQATGRRIKRSGRRSKQTRRRRFSTRPEDIPKPAAGRRTASGFVNFAVRSPGSGAASDLASPSGADLTQIRRRFTRDHRRHPEIENVQIDQARDRTR